MTQPEEQKPVAPTTENAQPAVDPTQPAAPAAVTAPTDDEIAKRERDLKAETGRKIQKARDQAARAEAEARAAREQIAALQHEVAGMRAIQSKQAQERIDERLLKMPPEQRLLAEFQMLKEEVRRKPEQPAQSPPPTKQQDLAEYIERKSKQLLEAVNKTFDLEEEAKLSEKDRTSILESMEEDDGEEEFYEAARKLALRRMKEGPVAKKNESAEKPAEKPVDQQALAQQITEQVLQSLGVSRGSSPRPASGGSVQVTSDDLQQTVRGYSSKKGPQATLAKLQEIREEAMSKVTRPKK